MKFSAVSKKLQTAINRQSGGKITIHTSQWYSEDKKRVVTCYTVRQTFAEDKYRKNIELFKTYSLVQLTLFLRDYWYELNGWEVPTDNEIWEGVKAENGTTYKKAETG